MTNRSEYRYQAKKPIRGDRVLIAVLVVAALIVIPVLLVRQCTHDDGETAEADSGLLVISDDTTIPDETVGDVSTEGDGETTLPTIEERILRHTVTDGESIADVAEALDVSVAVLLASNRLYGSEQLQPGEVLYASHDGLLHTIQQGQTLTDISLAYAVPVGTLAEANGLVAGGTIYAGDRILIPGVTTSYWADVVTLSRGQAARFIWPVEGEVVSTFGPRVHPVLGNRENHDGIDIDVPEGTTVRAAAGGTVSFYGEQPGYGNLMIIEHGDGFYTLYGHLEDAIASTGRYVDTGQPIALSGNTGISSGPHLHFEVRNGEFPIDPLRYLP